MVCNIFTLTNTAVHVAEWDGWSGIFASARIFIMTVHIPLHNLTEGIKISAYCRILQFYISHGNEHKKLNSKSSHWLLNLST